MSAPLLHIAGLGRRFRGVVAVDAVSFAVAPGAAHGLIGPNGAGKTTCFNLISGLISADTGQITLDGTRLDRLPPHQRTRAGLARTFQNIRLFGEMSVLENTLCGQHARRLSARAGKAQALELLDLVGLAASSQRRAGELSYGDQRRLEIARALASAPKLLLLDEPAAGMNPAETASLASLLQRVREDGTSLLLVEHDMNFVMTLCDRITVLNFGRVIADGAPREIRENAAVIEAYLGSKLARKLAGTAS
jgi:ABC-type branched-subunit amino acid transport system ATPase component